MQCYEKMKLMKVFFVSLFACLFFNIFVSLCILVTCMLLQVMLS